LIIYGTFNRSSILFDAIINLLGDTPSYPNFSCLYDSEWLFEEDDAAVMKEGPF
jgi:hypothetical protein